VAEPRLYQSGPNIGKPIQEYPKMLYRKNGAKLDTVLVSDAEGQAEATRGGWGEHPDAAATRKANADKARAELDESSPSAEGKKGR
jgi:hypothetical protein